MADDIRHATISPVASVGDVESLGLAQLRGPLAGGDWVVAASGINVDESVGRWSAYATGHRCQRDCKDHESHYQEEFHRQSLRARGGPWRLLSSLHATMELGLEILVCSPTAGRYVHFGGRKLKVPPR